MPDRFMMATRATHKTGDLSRDVPALAIIYPDGDREDHYVGQWAAGIGFIDVQFPKATTRPLNADEREQYGQMVIECAGSIQPIVLDEP